MRSFDHGSLTTAFFCRCVCVFDREIESVCVKGRGTVGGRVLENVCLCELINERE